MNCQMYNGNVTLNPIVTRQVNVVNRYYVIEQPHILEVETKFVNHYIKRHHYIQRPVCSEENTYSEQNMGCCQDCQN